MKINKFAIEAIRNADFTGENVAALFEKMAIGAMDSTGSLLILSYVDPDRLPEEGELVPTITFALKPFSTPRAGK